MLCRGKGSTCTHLPVYLTESICSQVQLLEGLPMHLQQGLSLNNDASTNSNVSTFIAGNNCWAVFESCVECLLYTYPPKFALWIFLLTATKLFDRVKCMDYCAIVCGMFVVSYCVCFLQNLHCENFCLLAATSQLFYRVNGLLLDTIILWYCKDT